MWCYHKPGFQALLLAELQRQQQCSQFCDILLKTEGVSVPAHSCILSAISPHISSTLSATPPPPAGQSRLLEFRALGACTLLHMARLLYCGEMAGEGEKEKQEAISAAAKLGIHGLVEVTKKDRKSRNEIGWHTEVGVQTEPLVPEANEGRPCRCRRDVTDASAFLWKETLLDGKKDTWTQTEEPPVKAGPPSLPAASFETIDVTAFQSLGQTDSHCVPPQIPYMSISLTCPPDENPTHQPSFPLVNSMQESTAAVVLPACTFVPPPLLPFSGPAADLRSWWADPQGAARDVTAAEEWEDKQLEQFQGNIPGYISYFLKPNKEEGSGRGRARRGRGTGGARRAGTAERRARRPRARTPGRGRGGLTQMVDVQDVGVSRLQKLVLQRLGPSRTGQGGGAVGRKLYLKTRELLKSAKSCQRGRGLCKMLEFSPGGAVSPYSVGGKGNTQRGRRSSTQQFNQDRLHGGVAQTTRAKPTTSVSFSSPHMKFCNVQTLSAFSPSCQPSPSPAPLLPAASYVPTASSLLRSTSPPPPHEVQPEHLDRLLEEVMMGLAILPNNNNSTPHSQPPLPTSSSSCAYASCGNTLAQNKLLLEASPCLLGSTQVVAIARGSGSSNNDMPVLQQQGEAELNEMLDHFLQSFEQHVDSCTAREEVEMGGQSCTEVSQPYTVRGKYRKKKSQTARTPHIQNTNTPRPARRTRATQLQLSDEAETAPRLSQPLSASACSAAPPKHTEGPPGKVRAPARKRKRRRKKEYLFSLEKKQVRVKKPVPTSGGKAKIIHDRREKQLQQMPVVKLKRSGQLPAKVTLQKPSCLEVKSPKAKTGSSSVKCPRDSCITKRYPIRSRLREAQMDSLPFLEKPLEIQQPPTKKRGRGRPRKNGQLPSLSNGESSIPPIQPQPVEPCGTDEQLEKRHEEELTVQPQEVAEGPTMRGEKRAAESEEVTSDKSTVTKRVCFEQTAAPTSETSAPSSRSADFLSEPATRQIEDIPLTSVRDCLQRNDREEKTMWIEIKLRETEEGLMDEEMESRRDGIDSEGDHWQGSTAPTLSSVSLPSHSAKEISPGSTGSLEEDKDEDVDVIGSSTPIPEPVMISWTESSEGEEEEGDEDIDVVGEKTDRTPPAVFATVSNQTEVLLH